MSAADENDIATGHGADVEAVEAERASRLARKRPDLRARAREWSKRLREHDADALLYFKHGDGLDLAELLDALVGSDESAAPRSDLSAVAENLRQEIRRLSHYDRGGGYAHQKQRDAIAAALTATWDEAAGACEARFIGYATGLREDGFNAGVSACLTAIRGLQGGGK